MRFILALVDGLAADARPRTYSLTRTAKNLHASSTCTTYSRVQNRSCTMSRVRNPDSLHALSCALREAAASDTLPAWIRVPVVHSLAEVEAFVATAGHESSEKTKRALVHRAELALEIWNAWCAEH